MFFDYGIGKVFFDERNICFIKSDFYIDAGFIIGKLGFFHFLLYVAVFYKRPFF